MQIWLQQEGESGKAYDAFKIYLETRNVKKVAETLQKSYSYTRDLAARNNWRERCRAFDSFNIEEARQKIIQAAANRLWANWLACHELQEAALAALRLKDLTKASFKSLNEIFHSAFQAEMKLLEANKIFDYSDGNDNNLTINIIPVSKPKN